MAQIYLNQALAPSTQRTYLSAESRYITFCNYYNIPPLPVNISSVCALVASLAAAYKSIKGYLSAIRYYQIMSLGYDPNISGMAVLGYVLQGIKRSQALAGSNKPRTRLPITSSIMRNLKSTWEHQGASYNHKMLWAACCTCFFGFLRSGEAPTQSSYDPAVHLLAWDVSVDSAINPRAVIICIKASKTDPLRSGINIISRQDR